MYWDLVFIFALVLSILVTVLTFGSIAGQRTRKFKLEKLEIEARIEEAKAAQRGRMDRNDADIEDRLRVLERIVTDPSADLSRQIEDLRELSAEREEVQ